MFISTFHYKNDDYKHLPLREHPLKFLYGLSFFLLDVLEKSKQNKLLSKRDKKLSDKLSKLYVGINPIKLLFIYKSKIISFMYALLFVFSALGLIVNILSPNHNNSITSLSRPTNGNSAETYELTAVIDGETSDIILEVESAAYSLEQALSYFELHRENIEKSILGHNTNLYEIADDIVLSNKVDDISISWDIENTNLIDYDGHILMENIPNDGIMTSLYANLTYKGHSATITIPIYILKVADLSSANDHIQSQLENENNIYDSTISLPTNVNGHSVEYYTKEENTHIPF